MSNKRSKVNDQDESIVELLVDENNDNGDKSGDDGTMIGGNTKCDNLQDSLNRKEGEEIVHIDVASSDMPPPVK